jgi:toxin FitB
VLTSARSSRGSRGSADAETRIRLLPLERWLTDVEAAFGNRILPVTLPVAAAWGRQQHARPLPVIDALIASTARVRGMTVVTRNTRDFVSTV